VGHSGGPAAVGLLPQDMFKKGGAAAEPEYHWLWCVPAVTWTGLYAAARLNGYPGMDTVR